MKKTVLLILDGWGKGRGDETDGIHLAHTPFMDGLYEQLSKFYFGNLRRGGWFARRANGQL